MREKLIELLAKYFDIGDSYAYNLTRVKSAFACGTMGFDDFEEFDDETVADIADHLIANGVTISKMETVVPSKWISVKDRLPQKWQHVLAASKCGDAYSIDFDHICSTGEWYGNLETEYKVTHWMPLPEPPKGE